MEQQQHQLKRGRVDDNEQQQQQQTYEGVSEEHSTKRLRVSLFTAAGVLWPTKLTEGVCCSSWTRPVL